MLGLAFPLVVACSPNLLAKLADRDVEGPGVTLRQRRAGTTTALELVDAAGKTRWRDGAASPMDERPVFSADGRLLAMEGGYGAVRVWSATGKRSEVKVLPLVTPDEHDLIPVTNCGLQWLDGLRFEGEVLVVSVRQRTFRVEGLDDALPSVELLVDVGTAKVTRRAPPQASSIPDLIAAYRSAPSRRLEVARLLAVKARAHRTDATLAAFLGDEVKAVKEEPLLGVLKESLSLLSKRAR